MKFSEENFIFAVGVLGSVYSIFLELVELKLELKSSYNPASISTS